MLILEKEKAENKHALQRKGYEAGSGYLSEVVQALLQQNGDQDDDGTDGGHRPRRRLVELSRVSTATAFGHCQSPTRYKTLTFLQGSRRQ